MKCLCLLLLICGVGCVCNTGQQAHDSRDEDIGMNDCFRIYPSQLSAYVRNGVVGNDGDVAERLGNFYGIYQGDFQRDVLWYWIGADRGNLVCAMNLSARIVNSKLTAPALMKIIERIQFSKMELDVGLPDLVSKDVLECRGVGIYDIYEIPNKAYVDYCVRRMKVDEACKDLKSVCVLFCNGDLSSELKKMTESGAFREFGNEYCILVKALNRNQVRQEELIQKAVKIFPEIAEARIEWKL